jgi:hypothetical protein
VIFFIVSVEVKAQTMRQLCALSACGLRADCVADLAWATAQTAPQTALVGLKSGRVLRSLRVDCIADLAWSALSNRAVNPDHFFFLEKPRTLVSHKPMVIVVHSIHSYSRKRDMQDGQAVNKHPHSRLESSLR